MMPTGKPQVTIYGPLPTEDLQLANKAYVDALPKSVVVFGFYTGTLAAATLFFPPFANPSIISDVTESDVAINFTKGLKLLSIHAIVRGNNTTVDSVLSFRDDGADVAGSALTITLGTTGKFDLNGIDTDIASGSDLAWRILIGTTGGLQLAGLAIFEVIT